MLARLPGHVWRRWQEYQQIRSFGPLHEDVRAGVVASLLFNANRGKNQKALGPADFFPALKLLERQQTAEQKKAEQYRRGLAWMALLGAQAERARRLEKG